MQELETVTQHRLQKHMALSLGTIPRNIILYSTFRIHFIAVSSFCVCVLGIVFEALITSDKTWTEATACFSVHRTNWWLLHVSPNVKGQFRCSSQCTRLLPHWSSNPSTCWVLKHFLPSLWNQNRKPLPIQSSILYLQRSEGANQTEPPP